ncbi:MAG: DctP family TRAP transporter solute-binding subunit [Rhizobiales bacterium]|nr:DctP family TRAP transporter solute-binding subunit [Hyphomicrobiales bacterium]
MSAVPALSAEIELRLAHVAAESEPLHAAAVFFADAVEKRSKGRISITVHPSGQLGSNAEVYEQVKVGAPIIQVSDPGYLSDYEPNFGVLNGPYLLEDPADFQKLLNSDLYAEMIAGVRKTGNFEVLSMNWLFGARHIISNRSVTNLDEAKGLKIRVPPNVMWIETMKAMGADGIQIAWAEVYTGLSSGVVAAAEAPLASIWGAKLYESAKEISMTGHFKAFVGLAMNSDLYASYPEDIQTILSEEAVAAGIMITNLVLRSEAEYRAKLEAEGVTFHTAVDVEAFQKATASVYEQFPKWSKGLYARVRKVLDN